MGAIDEASEVVRLAVQPRRGEEVDPVVAPAELAAEVGDGEDFEDRDAEFGKVRKLLPRGGPRSLGSERADVQFVDHLTVAPDASPDRIGPCKPGRVDDLGRPVRTFGLKPRRGVGIALRFVVEVEAIARAGGDSGRDAAEVAVAFGSQCNILRGRRALEADRHRSTPRRPDSKAHPIGLDFGPDGVTSFGRHGAASPFGFRACDKAPLAPASGERGRG